MRRGTAQQRAFVERVRDQTEVVAFEIAEPAMDELRRSRRGGTGEIALLHQADGKSAASRIARQAAAIDAAADHGDVVNRPSQIRPRWNRVYVRRLSETAPLGAFRIEELDRGADPAPQLGAFLFARAQMLLDATLHFSACLRTKLCDCSTRNREDVFIRYHETPHSRVT